MTNRVRKQLLLGLFWFGSAYLAVGALSSWEWAWRWGLINLIMGMLGLLVVTRTEKSDSLFYTGSRGEVWHSSIVVVLWFIPVAILFIASVWWLVKLLEALRW